MIVRNGGPSRPPPLGSPVIVQREGGEGGGKRRLEPFPSSERLQVDHQLDRISHMQALPLNRRLYPLPGFFKFHIRRSPTLSTMFHTFSYSLRSDKRAASVFCGVEPQSASNSLSSRTGAERILSLASAPDKSNSLKRPSSLRRCA